MKTLRIRAIFLGLLGILVTCGLLSIFRGDILSDLTGHNSTAVPNTNSNTNSKPEHPAPSLAPTVVEGTLDGMRLNPGEISPKQQIYDMADAIQDAVQVDVFDGRGEITEGLSNILHLSKQEKEEILAITKVLSKTMIDWEAKNAVAVPNSNIIKVPPSGIAAKNAVASWQDHIVHALGENRGAFLLRKAKAFVDLVTAYNGETGKVLHVEINQNEDGSMNESLPYKITEKVLRIPSLLEGKDWSDPSVFHSSTISNLGRTDYFREIPERYKHFIEPAKTVLK